jgi:hypothetical protein
MRLKYSAAFIDFIISYFRDFDYRFEDIRYGNDLIVAKETLYENTGEDYRVSIDKAVLLIEDRCRQYFRRNMRAIKLRLEREHEDVLLESELNAFSENTFGILLTASSAKSRRTTVSTKSPCIRTSCACTRQTGNAAST